MHSENKGITKLQLKLTRNSVGLGDDCEDHSKIIDIYLTNDMLAIIFDIAKKYLPTIAGFAHSWDCILNGKFIAKIQGNCRKIKQIDKRIILTNISELHFKYNSSTR